MRGMIGFCGLLFGAASVFFTWFAVMDSVSRITTIPGAVALGILSIICVIVWVGKELSYEIWSAQQKEK